MPEIVQNQTNNPKPPRRKKNKEIHNAVERHRKEKINSGINRIGDLLPCSQALKQSKNMILGEAFRYITELKRQNDEMLLNGGDKVQAEEIKRLRCQLEDLRKESAHYIELLKANGINFLDDPTIHWKGKQRCAKVAKVTPTHLSKGIIVYSNGNTSCPSNKVSIPPNPVSYLDKQTENAATVQPSCDITLGSGQTLGVTNGAQVSKVVVSSASSHIPVATLIPAVSKPCLTVVEQYSPLAPVTPRINPPVNYITLQGLCPQPAVTTPLPPQLQPDNPTPSLTSATAPAMPLRLQPMLSLSSLPQVVINNSMVPAVPATLLSQNSEIQSLSPLLSANSTLLRTSATSSTQTTWTTLQLAGNTVQPVSQALVMDGASISQNPQQPVLASVGTKHPEEPASLQLQPHVPMQLQAPTPTHIPIQPSGARPPQVYSAVVPRPQTAIAQQSSLLSVPAIVSQAVVVHQPPEPQPAQLTHPQLAVRSQPALLPKPQPNSALMPNSNPTIQPKPQLQPVMPSQPHSQPTAVVPQLHLSVVPQAQPIMNPPTQPALVPQPQAATLPVLQTMQVLQVNSDETPVAVTSSPQNNSHVVILQQGSSCPAPQVLREDMTNQTPCQHIVIIQAPTLTPAPQSHHTAIASSATPTLSSQLTTSIPTCTTSMQAAGTKQLVHILPRPSTQLQAQAPQTITVNGQVYVLQPAKSPEKGNSQAGQSVTQILQPTSEEPTSNVAMNCLGALTSLSQSISKVSSQSNLQIYTVTPPSYTTAQSPHPMNGSVVSTCAETVLSASVPLPTTAAGSADKILPKKGSVTSGNRTRQTSVRRSKLVRRKDVRRVAAKSKALVANDSCSEMSTVATGGKSLNSVGKDMVNHGNNTQCAPTPISVSSTGSSSGVISVSSSSEKLADNSVSLSVNGSIVKPSVVSGEISKTKTKSTDVATMPNNVTVSSVSSPVSSAQSSIVVSSSCDSMNKDIFTAHIGPQPNCSVVSVALSSQCSTVDTVATMSVTTPEIHVNSSCSVSFSSESGSQNKVAISSNCSSNKGRSIESSPSITGSSVPLTTVSSTQNNSTVKCVESALCQPTVSSEVSTPNRQLNVGTGSSESGLIVSIMPGQTISQIQDKFARGEELDNSPQIQASFRMPSTSTPGSVTSMSTPAVQLPVTSGVSDSFKSLKQPSEMNISIPTTSHGTCTDFKMAESNMNTQPGKDVHTDGTTAKDVIDVGPFVQKATVPAQQICSIENDSFEPPIGTIRQTDSPLAGGSGGRGFSVASLLPPGHNISASPGTFGAYTFTSEQAEILAMAARAIFEQDSPGKRAAGCSVDNPTSTAATGWDLPKMQSSPSNKESMADQQVKLTKQADLPVSKTSSQVSGRRGPVEPLASGTAGVRLSQSIAYSQSQPSTVTSLNVNNLIRPSSSQPYPGSPNLGQQVSAPSSVGAAIMVSQSSSQVPPPCSGPAQSNEYAPLKNTLMRTHVGVGMVDRHQKDMPKRSAQDDLILPNKRSKPCPAGSVARADIKATDHVQMMVSQMPSSTSAVMTRNHSDGVGALFAGNTFMSTVLRPAEGHCSTQVPTHEQTVLHLQQGHSQHSTPQSGQNLGGNPYLKHQQQQDQRHLYQLQHHLTQPESQIHTIHQRTLLQDQHVHKKRGVVRGGQAGPTVALQKQHHLEKSAVQQQHQQQQTPQQHQHQQQQSQQHQQQQQQQHHQQQQQKAQQLQQQQQSHQQQQQQIPPQNSHSRHQHIQQQIQQQHFGARQDKNCEAQQAGQRAHQNNHLGQPERPPGQDHGAMQRLMGSRSMEQQLTSQASNSVSRSSDLACTPSRQERHRLSSYSAEALIGKTSAAGEQRMGVHLQTPRNNTQDQSELRGYVDSSHGKGNIAHSQSRLPPDHANTTDTQRIQECLPFKTLVSGHQLSNFEVQVSRSGDMSSKSVPQIQRGPQSQTGFRMGSGPNGDGRARGTYSGPHPAVQGVHIGAGLPREQEGCHQSFMHSLLAPHIPEQNGHQRATQGCTPSSIEYSCVPGTSAGELQAKSSSPNLHPAQKAAPIRLGDNNKGRISQVSGNLHGPPVRAGPPHPPAPHSSSDTGRTQGTTRSLSAVSQRPHHIGPDPQSTKIRPGDRPRSGNLRPGNPFEPESSLPLTSTGGVLLGRTQTGSEARRTSIVRFMPDGAQVSGDNNLVSDQHLTQNFGFPFIAEGGMNPPPPINANASFIPPVSQPSASRTPALLPVEPQNTLPSFYPSYSPAAHPSLPSEIPLQYFSNQMFTSPSTDKSASAPLNNRFGSILSPPRPVGFAQASFPLLTDITPMPIANSSGITPHLSNFNLTSLFPEIATAMPPDGSSMPMSPLLSLANTSSSDSNKQSNRPAHNISHILGHDGTSAV